MYERFTDRGRKVMQLANQEAQRFNHEYIGTEHILLGVIKEGSGVAANVIKNLDVDLRRIRLEVEKILRTGPDMVTMGKLPQTLSTKKVIEYAMEEARKLSHNYVGTEHIVMGLMREQDGVAAQVLMNLGLKLEDYREEVLNLLGHGLEMEDQKKDQKMEDQKKDDLEARFQNHVLVLDTLDQIKELNELKENAVSNQDFNRAADLRDKADRLISNLKELYKILEQHESVAKAQDKITRFCCHVPMSHCHIHFRQLASEIVKELFAGKSILLFGQPGSGRAALVGLVAVELFHMSGQQQRLPLRLVMPNFREIREAAKDNNVLDIIIGIVKEMETGQSHALAMPEAHQCCDSNLFSEEVGQAWKILFNECVTRQTPMLAWTTSEGQQRLNAQWPGVTAHYRQIPMPDLPAEILEEIAEEEVLKATRVRNLKVEENLAGQILSGRLQWSEGEHLCEPGRAIRFIHTFLDYVDSNAEKTESKAVDELTTQIQQLKHKAQELILSDRYADAEQLLGKIRILIEKQKKEYIQTQTPDRFVQTHQIDEFLRNQHVS